MTVRMLSTRQAAPDGLHVQWFKAGEVYEVPDHLASMFVSAGWAVLPGEPAATVEQPEPVNRKAIFPPLKGKRK